MLISLYYNGISALGRVEKRVNYSPRGGDDTRVQKSS